MMESSDFLILIVTNGAIMPEYYAGDPLFSGRNYVFLNVGAGRMEPPGEKFSVLNSADVPGYVQLGREWAESEAIYNMDAVMDRLGRDYGEVGLLHWDFNFREKNTGSSEVTALVRKCLSAGYRYISFFPAQFRLITGMYNVMMDERQPNCLFTSKSGLSDPRSANEYVLDYFSSSVPGGFSLSEGAINPVFPVSMCCAGLFPREWFAHARKFMERAMSDGVDTRFDTQKRHRFPGQLMERFVALDSVFRRKALMGLDHRFTGGLKLKADDPDGENY